MLASRNAAVEAGKAWAARPSVPAAPATALAVSELPQPASTRPARASAAQHRRAVAGGREGVERSCPHFIGGRDRAKDRERAAKRVPCPTSSSRSSTSSVTHPGFRSQRARLGWQLASQRLGASIWEIEPGEAAYPYHYHLAEEELLIVLMGRPSVRTDGEWRAARARRRARRSPAARKAATRSRTGATSTARFLAVSTSGTPDLVVYPDSGKLGAFERLPDRDGLWEIFRVRRRRRLPRRRAPARRAPAPCTRERLRPSGAGRASRLPSSHAARRRHRDRARRRGRCIRRVRGHGAADAGARAARARGARRCVHGAPSTSSSARWRRSSFWATYPDPSDDRSPPSRWPAAPSARCSARASARTRATASSRPRITLAAAMVVTASALLSFDLLLR